jgi:hypothetical protein
VSFSDNVFMGFVYGIARGAFPLTLSLRLQTPDVLVTAAPAPAEA